MTTTEHQPRIVLEPQAYAVIPAKPTDFTHSLFATQDGLRVFCTQKPIDKRFEVHSRPPAGREICARCRKAAATQRIVERIRYAQSLHIAYDAVPSVIATQRQARQPHTLSST